MKTYKNLINHALSDECMDAALIGGIKGKRDRPEVIQLLEHKDRVKQIIREKILNRELKPFIHRAHTINDGFTHKVRTIIQPYFSTNRPEQWIHHIVVHALKPIFMRGMYEFFLRFGSRTRRSLR